MEKLKAGIIGATGMVGQRFITLLQDHPYFKIEALYASKRSANLSYEKAVEGRWKMTSPIPESVKNMVVGDAENIDEIAKKCDFVFCAISMSKEETKVYEEKLAKAEIPVISSNSAHRMTPDVPMIIPEINSDHTDIIPVQRKRLGTKRGFISSKPNCSIQSYVPILQPLMKFEPYEVFVTTYQAISGAGKTFADFPEIEDNIIPFISGEEEKSEIEPLKIWGKVTNDGIELNKDIKISAQCLRVPVSDGHMAAFFVKFKKKPTKEEMIKAWAEYEGEPQKLKLPSAPEKFVTYFEEPDRPQTKPDRNLYKGMGVSVGRIREDMIFDYKFVGLSHNTLRGAAGGAVEAAELIYRKGYFEK